MTPIFSKSFRATALAFGLVAAPLSTAALSLLTPAMAHAQSAPTLAEMKQTLKSYGEFVSHAKYGEVWKPTVTPRGWHPYPACDWVYTKDYGWYFNDKTVWGAIVHHYGRWIHEAADGWLWVPGAEFSPGWVVWRTSAEWVGWAPTPPDAELTPVAMEAFDDDKLWTFMDAKKFGSTCEGGAPVAQYGDIWRSTTYVTDIRFVNGVSVFVLPTWIVGPIVNIDIDVFAPWSPTFIGSWVWNWTSVFNDVDIDITVVKTCGPNDPQHPGGQTPGQHPGKPLIKDIKDYAPPPPPPGAGPKQRGRPVFEPNLPSPSKRVEERGFQPGRRVVDEARPPREVQPEREVVDGGRQPGRIPGGRKPGREVGGGQPADVVTGDRTPGRGFGPQNFGRRDFGQQGFGKRDPRRVVDVEPQGRRDRGPDGGRGRDFDRGFAPRGEGRREAGSRTPQTLDVRRAGLVRSFGADRQSGGGGFRRID